jgi:myotubularin-related protein 1/2
METQKKSSTSMYELLSVNEMKPLNENKDNKDKQASTTNPNTSTPNSNQNTYINTGNLNSLSSFLNSANPIPVTSTGEIDFQNKIQVVKGDFYTDPELIQKNCELFAPETIKNTVQAFIIFNENLRYKGILVLTEYRLIFKERNPMPIKTPKNYFKFPLMSIAKLEKIQNPKSDYDTYLIDITLKDTRVIRFYVKDNIHSTFFSNLESTTFPKDLKNLYTFSEAYHNEIKKEKNYFNGWNIYDPIREFSRQGVTEDNNLGLRFCYANKNFKLCETYPEFLIEPAQMTDEDLKQASQYRTKNRLPIMTYYHYNPNSDDDKCVPTIWRSAQNKGGLMGSKKNDADINLIKYIKDMSKNLYIYDCRPKLNAMVNRLNGGGFENMDHYEKVDSAITFCEIDNIHKARNAINSLYSLCLSEKINDNFKFWSAVDNTGWFTFVYLLLRNADEISKKIQDNNSVLIHCSDGWDRTSQLSSLSQILLDPFFRTINGFAILIEKDWLSFGHQFALRNGISIKQSSEDQSSPIFLQFLDAVHQLLLQYPNSFEFNEKFLIFLAKVHNLNLYGTFMFNNDRHRSINNAKETTISVWTEIYRNIDPYLNIYYDANSVKILEPNFAYYNIKLWTSLFMENNLYLRNEKFFVNDYDSEVSFSNVNDFYIYEKEMDKKKMKEKDDKYNELMKLTSGFYSKIKDNEELINSLDDKSKEILNQVKSKLLLIEKMKGPTKK